MTHNLRIVLKNGNIINLLKNNSSALEILKVIENEKSEFILIGGHSPLRHSEIVAIMDMDKSET